MKIKLGILCPSEIAFRRFLPALNKADCFELAGIAIASKDEWNGDYTEEQKLIEEQKASLFNTTIFNSYKELVTSPSIDAVYIPLPPALHYKWVKLALANKKHVFCEKPFTTDKDDTNELCLYAAQNDLALHENYMFVYHSQLDFINKKLQEDEIGDVRLFRIDFGFPFRSLNDFRYNKELGGGALLDCGGYTFKLATLLLGDDIKIKQAHAYYRNGIDVDISGDAVLQSEKGTAQVSFGMDNDYRCSLDIWGSKGTLYTNRILTAPENYQPIIEIKKNGEIETNNLPSDDTFLKSLLHFHDCIINKEKRDENYKKILIQANLVDKFVIKCSER